MQSSLLLVHVAALVATLAVFVHSQATPINYNCPGLGDGAVIQLKPCFANSNMLSICTQASCGPGTMSTITVQPLTSANNTYGNWQVMASSSDLPPGYVRLATQAPGMTGAFLAAQANQQTYPASPVSLTGYEVQISSYVDNQNMAMWQWVLPSTMRSCRVKLSNLFAGGKDLGMIPNGPTTNGFMRPVDVYDNGLSVTDNIWEVYVITPAPTGNAYAVTSAAYGAATTTTNAYGAATTSTTTTAAYAATSTTTTSTTTTTSATTTTAAASNNSSQDEFTLSI